MAQVVPVRFAAVPGMKNRIGKVFIDYLRNSRGASTVAPFSVRARPGMAVSMPIPWDEVESVTRGAPVRVVLGEREPLACCLHIAFRKT
jgi:bifunctional non-homologous end joining protein LigD